jgi:hypothetical protein
MKRVLVTLVCFGLLVVAHATGQSRNHVLDLTRSDVVRSAPATETGSGSGSSGERPLRLPLELRISALDRAHYAVGDRVVYEITMKNASTAPFVLPWSVDRALVEESSSSFVQGTLALAIVDQHEQEYLSCAVILDGSEAVPGSTEKLAPGETATIRATGILNFSEDRAAALAGGGIKFVRAVFTMRFPQGRWSDRLVSENVLPLSLVFRSPTGRN